MQKIKAKMVTDGYLRGLYKVDVSQIREVFRLLDINEKDERFVFLHRHVENLLTAISLIERTHGNLDLGPISLSEVLAGQQHNICYLTKKEIDDLTKVWRQRNAKNKS